MALYYDVYLPGTAGPKPLLIALHGYGSNKNGMMKIAQGINRSDYVIASLQGPYQHFLPSAQTPNPLRPGFGWITRFKPEDSIVLHHNTVKEIITILGNEGKIDAENVFLLGFSQSVSLNYRFAFSHAELIRGVIAINGGIPGDFADREKYKKADISVLHISGKKDDIYPPAVVAKQMKALRPLVSRLDCIAFNGGHEFPPEAFPVIDNWIKEKINNTNKIF